MLKPITDNVTAEEVKNRLLAFAALQAAQEKVDQDYWYGNIATYTLALRLSGIYGEKQFDDVITGQIDETLNLGKYPYLENEVFLRETSHLDRVNFVKCLYQAFLAREADAGGLEGNVAQLENGASRENLVIGLRSSEEADGVFLRVTECLDDRNFLEIVYRVYLKPENHSLRWEQDLQALRDGVERETLFLEVKQFQQLQTALQNREGDFYCSDHTFLANTQTMSDEEFVKQLYLTYCKREADPGGLEGNINQLKNGVTRKNLLFGLRTSEEAANVFVDLTAGLDIPTFIKVAYLAYRKEDLTPALQQQCLEILRLGNIRQTILRGDFPPLDAVENPTTREPEIQLATKSTISPQERIAEQFQTSYALEDVIFLTETADFSHQEFIEQVYLAYLGRPADETGLAAHVQQLQQGTPKAEILHTLRTSEEAANIFVEKTNFLSDREYLELAYLYFRRQELTTEQQAIHLASLESGASRQSILHNCPSFDFFGASTKDLSSEIDGASISSNSTEPIDNSLEQFIEDLSIEDHDFLANQEQLSDRDFVREIYQTFLRRPADSEGLEMQVEQLQQGLSRWDILYELRTSPEAANVFVEHTVNLDNSEFLDTAYRVYLKRDLDPDNKVAYQEYLDAGNPRQDILS